MSAPIKILLADDHEVVREGLASILRRRASEFDVVGEAGDGLEAEALYRRHRPDVLVIDLRMPARDGVTTVTAIRAFDPQARIVILTTYDNDEDIYQALRAGALGYLLKDAQRHEILDAIRTVARGQRYLPPPVAGKLVDRMNVEALTARETQVLRSLAAGNSNKEIARTLGVSEGTVKFHTNTLYAKLGVSSRSEAIGVAARRGLIRLD